MINLYKIVFNLNLQTVYAQRVISNFDKFHVFSISTWSYSIIMATHLAFR
jgi:hypothetical protein